MLVNFHLCLKWFQMVSLLLVKGANVKAKDRRERIPLHLAAYMGELEHLACDLVAKSLPNIQHRMSVFIYS